MKKSLIFYIIFVVIFFIVLYFTTMSEMIVRTQNDFNDQIFLEAKEEKEFDDFVKYQTNYFKKVKEINEDNYNMYLYHILIDENVDNLLVIIIPTNYDNISYASKNDEQNDQTRVLLKGKNGTFDTNDINRAISFGYNDDQVGFMFFNIKIEKDDQILYEYYDYNNNLIISDVIEITQVEEDDLTTFTKGYSVEEIKELMNLDEIIAKALRKRILIYLIIVVFAPFLYKLFKYFLLNGKKREVQIK